MSLRDKAGQLIVVGFTGETAPSRMITTLRPGGLIYFDDNLRSDAQIRTLSAASQRAARAGGQPLLIMTDQEGGPITRLPGTANQPGGAEFNGNARWARRTADQTGQLLRRLGINTDLAPVADVNTVGNAGVIGARSFSSDSAVVSRLVRAQVCGYHDAGVAAAAKHFPGHGSTTTDSHLRTAVINQSRQQWERVDLPPFQAAIKAHVDMVMVGHLAAPALDPSGRPATISPLLDRALLRDRLGFDGVVITDALNMGGITSWGDTGQNAVRSINGGADLLLMPPSPAQVVNALVAAVKSGTISIARLDASVERVLRLKQRLGLYAGPAPAATPAVTPASLPGC
ncbi:MAG: glycoside hydrolase family 3 protein [Nocardioidaceae bacterium]